MKDDKTNYIHEVRLDFLSALLKNWQKRNNRLLHIGVNHGIEPSFFWDLGFETSALCKNQEELEQCQNANGKKIDYYVGQIDHLPFDEKTFDYVVLTHALAPLALQKSRYQNPKNCFDEDSYQLLLEAQRVSTKGICFLEFSNFAFKVAKPSLSLKCLKKLREEVQENVEAKVFTALHSPPFLWGKKLPLSSSYPLNIPFGTLMALKLTHSPLLMTSLPLQISSAVSEI